MKTLLCLFVIVLSVCVYPVFLRVPIEIAHVFGLIEIDLFSWYRMWLVTIVGGIFLLRYIKQIPMTAMVYLLLVTISVALSHYMRSSIFGGPWMREGLLAIIGYVGIYLISKRYGLFPGLEASIDAVIFIVFIGCVLQLHYGNFLDFPPIKWMVPALRYQAMRRPLYSVLGCGNHLGLFSALFFPYAILKKKYWAVALLLFMAIGSGSRGSWAAMFITTVLISQRAALYAVVAFTFIAVPFHEDVTSRINRTLQEIHWPVQDKDLSGRAFIWSNSVPQLKRTLLLGLGPATYALYFPQHTHNGDEVGFHDLVVDRPHNMYLNIWIGTGLISLLVIGSGIGYVVYRGGDKALVLSCIAFLINLLVTDSVLCVTPYFVIFLGCLSHKPEPTLGHFIGNT